MHYFPNKWKPLPTKCHKFFLYNTKVKKVLNLIFDALMNILIFNPIVPNAPFLFTLKTSGNRKVF